MNEIIIGGKYFIDENFYNTHFPDDPGLDHDMRDWAGKEVTIVRKCLNAPTWYKVNENSWTWDSRWLIPVGEEFDPVCEDELWNLFNE